jgi:hypothetical protein
MLLPPVNDPTPSYRPAPVRRRANAHRKLSFWITWLASSLLLWAIVVKLIGVPPEGSPPVSYGWVDEGFASFKRMTWDHLFNGGRSR